MDGVEPTDSLARSPPPPPTTTLFAGEARAVMTDNDPGSKCLKSAATPVRSCRGQCNSTDCRAVFVLVDNDISRHLHMLVLSL